MPAVLPNEGLPTLLDQMIRTLASGFVDWTLVLWDNDIVPDQDTEYADLNIASFGGYSDVTVDHTEWTSPTIIDDRAVSTYTADPLEWIMSSGSGYVYGYAIVTSTSPIILWCERFAVPEPISAGRTLSLLPRITLTTEVLP